MFIYIKVEEIQSFQTFYLGKRSDGIIPISSFYERKCIVKLLYNIYVFHEIKMYNK